MNSWFVLISSYYIFCFVPSADTLDSFRPALDYAEAFDESREAQEAKYRKYLTSKSTFGASGEAGAAGAGGIKPTQRTPCIDLRSVALQKLEATLNSEIYLRMICCQNKRFAVESKSVSLVPTTIFNDRHWLKCNSPSPVEHKVAISLYRVDISEDSGKREEMRLGDITVTLPIEKPTPFVERHADIKIGKNETARLYYLLALDAPQAFDPSTHRRKTWEQVEEEVKAAVETRRKLQEEQRQKDAERQAALKKAETQKKEEEDRKKREKEEQKAKKKQEEEDRKRRKQAEKEQKQKEKKEKERQKKTVKFADEEA